MKSSGILCVIALCSFATAGKPSLPTVDLGYEIHKASFYNHTGNYYNFSNIRYADPPTGNHRFKLPLAPSKNRSVVQTGNIGRVCPQSNPAWVSFAPMWLGNYLANKPLNVTEAQLNKLNSSITAANIPPMDPRTTEDCLFLDVVVPKSIFDAKENKKGAPVLVWFYGGGYVSGDKTSSGNPAGLIERSEDKGEPGVIYVAFNYRLGVFGWLAGPTLQSDGVANAGLHDQRFALAWVKKYIHLFGGDPERVTVFGESAGGGSIMHQITAHGGNTKPEFQQAILQSPAFQGLNSPYQNEQIFNTFLQYANLSSLEAIRAAPSKVLIDANFLQVFHSTYGLFTYGPAVDGTFVPALPSYLLLAGAFSKDLKIMVGHNANEGLLFTNPFVKKEAKFTAALVSTFPEAAPSVISYIENTLYPPIYDGTHNYTSPIGRSSLLIGEYSIACNTYYLDLAFKNQTFSYLFDVPPGLHGQDIGFTYYNSGAPTPSVPGLPFNKTVALALQDYITTFAETGVPSSPDVKGIPKFTVYGSNAQVQDLGVDQIRRDRDPTANARCLWWQKDLYN